MHLTEQTPKLTLAERDRPAVNRERAKHGAPDESVAVTSEMVSAGVGALWPCELLPFQHEAEVLGRVYVAMRNARPGRR